MAALPQLMEPPPRLSLPDLPLDGRSDNSEKTSLLSRDARKKLLIELKATLTQREAEVGELEQFVAGLRDLKLETDKGVQPDEKLVEEWLSAIEGLFMWAARVAEERENKLCEIDNLLDELSFGDVELAPAAKSVSFRFKALSGRVETMSRVEKDDLIGNLLVQVAKQRELSSREKIRLLHTIPYKGPITDQQISTRRADMYSDSPSTHRSDWYK